MKKRGEIIEVSKYQQNVMRAEAIEAVYVYNILFQYELAADHPIKEEEN